MIEPSKCRQEGCDAEIEYERETVFGIAANKSDLSIHKGKKIKKYLECKNLHIYPYFYIPNEAENGRNNSKNK